MNTLKPVNPYIFKQNGTMQSNFNKEVGDNAKPSAKVGVQKNMSERPNNITESTSSNSEKIGNTEISKYIALMVKMENGVESGNLDKSNVQDLMDTFSQKIDELSPNTRKKLFSSYMFKETGISSEANFSEEATKMITEGMESDREKIFSFLKSNDFISALKNEPLEGQTFSPSQISRKASFG